MADWWRREFPFWPIHEGHHPVEEGPFNRSLAINRAAGQAGDWDVACIVDGDTFHDPGAIMAGVQVAAHVGCMVNCHDHRVMLTKWATERVLAGEPVPPRIPGHTLPPRWVEVMWTESPSGGVVVHRSLWDRLGGFDPKFVGWGKEDSAFRIACETVSGMPMVRIAKDAFHLWHPVAPETAHGHPARRPNEQRLALYEAADGDVDAVLNLSRGVL
ncbi:MAG: galactosyltransferase-related protein [Microthrixaceae bacterium]